MFLNNSKQNSSDSTDTSVFAESTLNQDNGIIIALFEAELVYKDMIIRSMELEHQFLSEGAEDRMEALEESFMDKAKDFFKKLWETIKAFFKRVYMWFEQLFTKKESYVKKHERDIRRGIDRLDDEDSYDGMVVSKLEFTNKSEPVFNAIIDGIGKIENYEIKDMSIYSNTIEKSLNIGKSRVSQVSGENYNFKNLDKQNQQYKADIDELETSVGNMLEMGELGKTEIATNANTSLDFYKTSVKKSLNDLKTKEKKMEKALNMIEGKINPGAVFVHHSTIKYIRMALRVINLEQKLLKAKDSECWKAVKKVMSKTQSINKFSDKTKYESTDLLGEFNF